MFAAKTTISKVFTKMAASSLLLSFLLSSLAFSLVESTPLDDYVNKPDPSYSYKDLGNPWKGDGYTSYFINMTSQTWLSGNVAVLCSCNVSTVVCVMKSVFPQNSVESGCQGDIISMVEWGVL